MTRAHLCLFWLPSPLLEHVALQLNVLEVLRLLAMLHFVMARGADVETQAILAIVRRIGLDGLVAAGAAERGQRHLNVDRQASGAADLSLCTIHTLNHLAGATTLTLRALLRAELLAHGAVGAPPGRAIAHQLDVTSAI